METTAGAKSCNTRGANMLLGIGGAVLVGMGAAATIAENYAIKSIVMLVVMLGGILIIRWVKYANTEIGDEETQACKNFLSEAYLTLLRETARKMFPVDVSADENLIVISVEDTTSAQVLPSGKNGHVLVRLSIQRGESSEHRVGLIRGTHSEEFFSLEKGVEAVWLAALHVREFCLFKKK